MKYELLDKYLNLLARMCGLTKSRRWVARIDVWGIYFADVCEFLREIETKGTV